MIRKKLALAVLCVVFASCNNLFIKFMDTNPDNNQSKFLVVFDKNGGDTEALPGRRVVTMPEDTVENLPFPPERSGYSFSGWNTDADGSGGIFTEATVVTENLIVFAQWLQN